MAKDIQRAAPLIEQADGLLITAGAGMGVDSGLPDFRGGRGLWRTYPALGREKLGFREIANPGCAYADIVGIDWKRVPQELGDSSAESNAVMLVRPAEP